MKLIFQFNLMLVTQFQLTAQHQYRVGYFNYHRGDIWAVCAYRKYIHKENGEYGQIYFKELL